MRKMINIGRGRSSVFAAMALLLAALGLAGLALPSASRADLPGGSVSVCQVTGSASVPNYAQVTVGVAELAAYLNQFPGSFVGGCPSGGGGGGGGVVPPIATVGVCQITIAGAVTNFAQVNVAIDQLNAFLSQYPGSFQGACPAAGTGGGGAGGTGGVLPNGSLTVCRITGTASVPGFAQVAVAVDQLAAYLNANQGSFVGTCPGNGAPAGTPGLLPNGFVTICHVSGSLSALSFAQLTVAMTDLQAALNRSPGSFVGGCPTAGDPNGNPGVVPSGFVTICKLTGNAATPYSTLTILISQLGVYLNQAGNIVALPTGGCPSEPSGSGGTVTGGSGPGSSGGNGPAGSSPGTPSTIVVHTTPNTVVTASGAGVNTKTKSDASGRSTVKVKPTKRGIVTIRGASGKVIKRIGVSGRQSGAQLTG
jgi:hypothetical protein